MGGSKISASKTFPRSEDILTIAAWVVTSTTDPDWEPIMKMAAAIVTDRGGRTSHAAIVSREMGVPAIVGTIDLETYVMCEIPSDVILPEKFAEIFDGFSSGSNDLTQLPLGVDRDSESIAHLFDERDDAVKEMVHDARDPGGREGRLVGLVGLVATLRLDLIVELHVDLALGLVPLLFHVGQALLELGRELVGGVGPCGLEILFKGLKLRA